MDYCKKYLTFNHPIIDAVIATMLSFIMGYVLNTYFNMTVVYKIYTNMLSYTDLDKFYSIFYTKYVVVHDGVLSSSISPYGMIQKIHLLDTSKAIHALLLENNNIDSVKEYIEIDTIYGTSKMVTKDSIDKYIIYTNKKLLLDKQLQIYVQINIQKDMDISESIGSNNKTADGNVVHKIITSVYSFTSNSKTIIKYLNTITDNYKKNIMEKRNKHKYLFTLQYYNMNKDHKDKIQQQTWSEAIFETSKSFDNIFFEDKQKLMNKLDFFMNNKKWYMDNGIPYTLGLGMYGKPGTGKTSIIKAISKYTNRHLVVISLKNIKTKEQLYSAFAETKYTQTNVNPIPFHNKIFVLEDIDCMVDIVLQREFRATSHVTDIGDDAAIGDEAADYDTFIDVHGFKIEKESNKSDKESNKSDKESNKSKTKEIQMTLTLDDILNLWDGLYEQPGRIIIITSNHYDKLDSALVRPGRIDITIELKCVNHKIIKEFYNKFYGEIPNEERVKEIEEIEEYKYTPAEVLNTFTNNMNNADEFIKKLKK